MALGVPTIPARTNNANRKQLARQGESPSAQGPQSKPSRRAISKPIIRPRSSAATPVARSSAATCRSTPAAKQRLLPSMMGSPNHVRAHLRASRCLVDPNAHRKVVLRCGRNQNPKNSGEASDPRFPGAVLRTHKQQKAVAGKEHMHWSSTVLVPCRVLIVRNVP